jgi:PadR family transcriptional regulator, regulatory protein PadR
MAKREFLGGFELLVLLALIRLGDEAYGVPISDAIEESSGREVAMGSVYITLARLERNGLVSSKLGEATAERGGRAKTYFRITAKGLRQVRQAQRTLMNLWQGVPQLQRGAV